MTIERNHSIDLLKFLCALLVVSIHCKYPYKDSMLPITDVAVPLFFCISGYFVCGAKRSWGRISRIAQIFAWSAALYLAKTEVFAIINTHSPWFPSWHAITNFLFFNDVAFAIHLWYLPAYIYVLAIAFFIDKYSLWKASFYLIIPLLLIGVFIKSSISDTCPEEIQYYRNAYFCGLPYFLLGGLIKLAPPRNMNGTWAKIGLTIVILVLFAIRYLFAGHGFVTMAIRELGLLLLTATIFLFAAICVKQKGNILSDIGRRYSLYIYIFHVLIMSMCETVATMLPTSLYDLYMYINPICVFLLSLAFTDILGRLNIIRI